MLSLREALESQQPGVSSAAQHAARIGMPSPVSLRELILASDVRVFEQTITTPPGTALGGNIRLLVAGDGRFEFSGHMHGSGFDPYSFSIHVFLRGDLMGLSVRKTGSVGGFLGGGSRDFDWLETGFSEALKARWDDVRGGHIEVSKSYEDTGLLGAALDVGKAFLAFCIGNVFIGQFAGFIVIGTELAQLANIHIAPDTFVGALAGGGVVMLCGPGMLIPAVIAGVAASTTIKSRHLNAEEETVARSVFGESLIFPRIYLTNLSRPDGRRFAVPQPDGSILVNMGPGFSNPLAPEHRGTFIHELVHAWQCIHAANPESLWYFATNPFEGDSAYDFSYSGERWSDMNIEAQASAVSTWFVTAEQLAGGLNGAAAISMPIYRYVAEHIRLGIA